MLALFKELYKNYDGNENELYVYLDFEKEFDSVSHRPLINKVHGFGIGQNFLKILSSRLTNREQNVNVNEASTETTEVSPSSDHKECPKDRYLGLYFSLSILMTCRNK